jgi:3-oxoacyl-[acyl-carrier protein] reductase
MILNKKISLVTGGNRGIGYSISKSLAKNGSKIILTYKEQKDTADQVVKEIKEMGGEASSFKLDICKRTSVLAAVEFCKEKYGRIDILVNNAGINKPTDFDKVTDEDWDNVLSVNLKGSFICSQVVFDLMRKQKSGSIINIGSVSGQYGGPRTAHYAASKAALISLGQVIARFGADFGIRCNTVAAGLIESEMASKGLKSFGVKKSLNSILLKRLGTPQEVADAVVFLSSNLSSYITGQTINVNGGLYF